MPTRDQTLPLTVENARFLVDRLGEDCHPLQFLRELTQNSIEAILRTGGPGEIVWDVDWNTQILEGPYKLSITDTGVGMTGPEMVRYINQLSSSGATQSLTGNYGVGAKIATATRNPAGVAYTSWKGGAGSTILFWRDPDSGIYGLKQFVRKGGSYAHWLLIEDAIKPQMIRDHGTMIVLYGTAADQDTMECPEGTPSPSRWITRYLNCRYFRFPRGITVKAREGWRYPREDADRNVLRTITGQQAYLDAHAEDHGQTDLTGAVAHWWILRDEPALGDNSGVIESTGHCAALYQDELYESATGRAGTARLQQFGIIFGHRQLVIYVEPEAGGLTTNISRTSLLLRNEPLPWVAWAAEFREQLPDPIVAFVQAKSLASASTDHAKSIRERLKPIMDLFKISRYRPAEEGQAQVDSAQTVAGGQPRPRPAAQKETGAGSRGTRGGTSGGIYALFEKEDGENADPIVPDSFPRVRWVTARDGTRGPDDMEDRAARYIPECNLLQINGDFRAFIDMVERCHKEAGGHPGLRDRVEQTVRGWLEQALVETVLGLQGLRGSKCWTEHHIASAFSEEALTAAAMPKYHILCSAKRELGAKLGKLACA